MTKDYLWCIWNKTKNELWDGGSYGRKAVFSTRQEARSYNPGYYYADELVVRKCKIQVIDIKRQNDGLVEVEK